MSQSEQELEVKFAVAGLEPFVRRLQALEAVQVQPPVHETNLRFDTPGGELTQAKQVLRLRRDTQSRLTFKGAGQIVQGVSRRRELEFSVSDFDSAQAFLEALGYQVVWMYEKIRQSFLLDDVTVTLDEMPFGPFMEIEGPDGARIQAAARKLDLDWEQRVLVSYAVLFERVCRYLDVHFRDLSFDNFAGLVVPPQAFTGSESSG